MKLNLKIAAATAAVAMMSSGAAFAGSIATNPATSTYSKEGLSLSGNSAVSLPQIKITFGNNLTYQDDIIITIPGVTSLVPAPLANLVQCYDSAGVALPGTAVGYVQLVPSGWNFRVTDISGVTIGSYCLFGNAATATAAASYLAVTASSLSAATSSTLNYQANRGLTSPVVIVDSATPLATGIVVKSQFEFTTVDRLNGIINVYKDRKEFFAAETKAPGNVAPANLHDTLNFNTIYGAPASFAGPTVTATGAVVTVTGDFSWVDGNDTNTTCDAGEWTTVGTGAIQGGSFADWAVDTAKSNCQQLVFNQVTATQATTSLTSFLNVPGTVVLSATDFTGNVEWSYGLTGTLTTTGKTGQAWDPGAWTINGAQVYIQYMPYGTGLSRIVYAANRGNLNPTVVADITANGSTFQCPLGTVASKTVASLSAGIDSCVAAKGITTGKVAILLTFIAPDSDIEVYSAYNAGGTDRGTVVNTSNGRSFFYGTGVNFTVTPTP